MTSRPLPTGAAFFQPQRTSPLQTDPFPLQRTQLIYSTLQKLIPFVSRGITLHNHLTVSCVRCSGKGSGKVAEKGWLSGLFYKKEKIWRFPEKSATFVVP